MQIPLGFGNDSALASWSASEQVLPPCVTMACRHWTAHFSFGCFLLFSQYLHSTVSVSSDFRCHPPKPYYFLVLRLSLGSPEQHFGKDNIVKQKCVIKIQSTREVKCRYHPEGFRGHFLSSHVCLLRLLVTSETPESKT